MKNYRTAAIIKVSNFSPITLTLCTDSKFRENSQYLDHDIDMDVFYFDPIGGGGDYANYGQLLHYNSVMLDDPNSQLVMRNKLTLYLDNKKEFFKDKYFPPLLFDYYDLTIREAPYPSDYNYCFVSLNLDHSGSVSTYNGYIPEDPDNPDPVMYYLKIGLTVMMINKDEFSDILDKFYNEIITDGDTEEKITEYFDQLTSPRMAEIMEEQGITDWQNYSSSGYYLPYLKDNPKYFSEDLLNGDYELTFSIEKYSEAQLTDEEKENIHYIGYYNKQTH